jgi:hypothetical protein
MASKFFNFFFDDENWLWRVLIVFAWSWLCLSSGSNILFLLFLATVGPLLFLGALSRMLEA